MADTDYTPELLVKNGFDAVNARLGTLQTEINALGTAEHAVADIAALLAYDAGLAATKKLNLGDLVDVADASGDTTVTSGWAIYRAIQLAPTTIAHFRKVTSEEIQVAQAAGPAASTLDLAALITN